MQKDVFIIKVASSSSVPKVSGSIVKALTENVNRIVEVQAIGAGAVNQTVKSLTTARGALASKGKDLYFKTGFLETEISGELRTVIAFTICVN